MWPSGIADQRAVSAITTQRRTGIPAAIRPNRDPIHHASRAPPRPPPLSTFALEFRSSTTAHGSIDGPMPSRKNLFGRQVRVRRKRRWHGVLLFWVRH
jgi:hypothetical protein